MPWQLWILGGLGLSKEIGFEWDQEQTNFSRERRWEGCSRERSQQSETQGLEKLSMADSQNVSNRTEGTARPGRDAGAWTVEGSSVLGLHFGWAQCQLRTQMQSSVKENFLI